MTLEHLKEQIIPILKKHRVKRAALFGSVVRGEETPHSDIDILVEFPKDASLFDLVELQYELKDLLKKEVDVVTYASLHHLIKDDVLKQQKVIL
ncbi:nucleotidyltransferase family protein [Candidatus Woesearchaeota archaeon]|nr:MAG: hypothetical protein QS99_C0016G0078 [archaeon GW2011_AR4]MBS3130285.1 nucleotidyltransferase family protein [Candidatus Woesearchaeota archaeon]HIH37332.1 nucleotidyltransferase family protein [Candidatus Woesearchaeota archaeon]HIH48759.1 nucleotidyltransferase family protein [Candidatus Woesearchaeota archaeon]HIJ04153.1 nucleotidyltransferase family protein [Candidatus Woesearchaeota archaeon]